MPKKNRKYCRWCAYWHPWPKPALDLTKIQWELGDNNKPYVILHRKSDSLRPIDIDARRCEPCPFCRCRHTHGLGDGHRVPHCILRQGVLAEIKIGDIAFRQSDGYIVKTV